MKAIFIPFQELMWNFNMEWWMKYWQLYVVYNNDRVPIYLKDEENSMCISVTFLRISVSFLHGGDGLLYGGIVRAADTKSVHSVFQHPAADSE